MIARTKARRLVKPERLTEEARWNEVRALVNLSFACLETYDLKEICILSGLSLSTIWRLRHGFVTLHTEIGTIQALGVAAGLQVQFEKYARSVRLVH